MTTEEVFSDTTIEKIFNGTTTIEEIFNGTTIRCNVEIFDEQWSQRAGCPVHRTRKRRVFVDAQIVILHEEAYGSAPWRTFALEQVNIPRPIFQDPHPKPFACNGCRNYYGKSDGDNFLVCSIHPYGCDGETCPDYEKERLEE